MQQRKMREKRIKFANKGQKNNEMKINIKANKKKKEWMKEE